MVDQIHSVFMYCRQHLPNYARKTLQRALNILSYLVGFVTFVALYVWLSEFPNAGDNPYVFGTPFTLAQVTAIFGGLGLVAGFSGQHDSGLRRRMRLVGNLYLVSAFGFTLFGLLIPIEGRLLQGIWEAEPVTPWIVAIALLVAISAFVLGTFFWIRSISRLIGRI